MRVRNGKPVAAPRGDWAACAFQAAPLQDLLIDYTRLFLGPVQERARRAISTRCWPS